MSRTTLTTKFQTMVGNEPGPLALSAKCPTTVLELELVLIELRRTAYVSMFAGF